MNLTRFFPFLRWFPASRDTLKADFIAGVTVALVLIPQSMAYAQLAGLPAYYGLYAAFLPVMLGAMWGSSHQLATGPVAVVSLLTALVLAPLAVTGSEQFIALAIALALMVGLVQLTLGLFKLGAVVNFLSHPVIIGFTNAAAIIIGLSQLNKMLGVSMERSESFAGDIWGVLQLVGETHWPTLLIGLLAILIMVLSKRFSPKAPGVLIAVIVTTAISWSIGFERSGTGKIDQIADGGVRALALAHGKKEAQIAALSAQILEKSTELKQLEKTASGASQHTAALKYQIEILQIQHHDAEIESRKSARDLRKFAFTKAPGSAGDLYYLHGVAPAGSDTDNHRWRIRKIHGDTITLAGGGQVVGAIPSGLPGLKAPRLNWDTLTSLLSAAFIISLVGFMEAISIAKAIAIKTKQRLDPNQELVGQGIANIAGSFTQCFPASGSFSRTAVNMGAGAKTGMSSLFTGLLVMIALLFLTPLLYHLPQSVLAAIIMMAVVGLVNFSGIKHAWNAQKHDGIAAVVTLIATLVFAPHLDSGILIGAGVAILLFLYRTMNPRVALLGRHADGTLRDAKIYSLPQSEYFAAVRFDGQLYFANVPYFEDAILEIAADFPKAKHILVVSDGINQMDASGEEVVHHLTRRLRENGITLVFSGLKRQVLDVMRNTGLLAEIGEQNIFASEDLALEAIRLRIVDLEFDAAACPLGRQPAAPAATQ